MSAGGWIKMRWDLGDDPDVLAIASALCPHDMRTNVRNLSASCPHIFLVVGALHRLWSWFDRQSSDGFMAGIGLDEVDETIGWAGFGKALSDRRWLVADSKGLWLPNFDRHNGGGAKRRALESKRKKDGRGASAKRPHAMRTESGLETETETEEETEKKKDTPPSAAQTDPPRGVTVAPAAGPSSGENPDTPPEPREGRLPRSDSDPPETRSDDSNAVAPPSRRSGGKRAEDAPDEFPEPLDTDGFRTLWAEWSAYRRQLRKPLTPLGRAKSLKQLAGWGLERATRAIEHTMAMGWQGIREPDPEPVHRLNGHHPQPTAHDSIRSRLERIAARKQAEEDACSALRP